MCCSLADTDEGCVQALIQQLRREGHVDQLKFNLAYVL